MSRQRLDSRKARGILRRTGQRDGFALVVVLFLIVLMSVTVAALTLRTSAGYRLARSRAVGWQLYYAGRAAVEEAKAELWREAIKPKKTPGILAPPKPMTYNEDGVEVTVICEDEAGKIPVNDFNGADDPRKTVLAGILARLFEELDLPNSTGLATSVRDYIDEDNDGPRERGAKNKMLFDISELMGAQGFTAEALFASRYRDLPTAASCLTTAYSGPLNINSVSPLVLKALEPSLADSDISAIVAARAERPYFSAEDLAQRSGAPGDKLASLVKLITFTTDTFSLKVEARQGAFTRRITAVIWIESSAAHTSYFRDGWQE